MLKILSSPSRPRVSLRFFVSPALAFKKQSRSPKQESSWGNGAARIYSAVLHQFRSSQMAAYYVQFQLLSSYWLMMFLFFRLLTFMLLYCAAKFCSVFALGSSQIESSSFCMFQHARQFHLQARIASNSAIVGCLRFSRSLLLLLSLPILFCGDGVTSHPSTS